MVLSHQHHSQANQVIPIECAVIVLFFYRTWIALSTSRRIPQAIWSTDKLDIIPEHFVSMMHKNEISLFA